jgi:c(7)-type cytochrome triheme protein
VAFRGPGPIVYKRGDASPGQVTFRHGTHVGPKAACVACHPKPFAMKSTGPRPDGAMHEPGACGMCHDGRRSFGVEDGKACARCHVEGKAGS